MIPLPFVPFSSTFIYKWAIVVIVMLALSFAFVYYNNKAYNNGYNAGIETTELKYNVEKLKWIGQVSKIQQDHTNTIHGILTSYNGAIADYEAEIDKLKSTDPVVKTRYIYSYVPVETNCTIPKGFIDLHNTSAKGQPLSNNPVNPGQFSNITLQDVSETVATNYYQYNKIAAQLIALQKVVTEFQDKQKDLTK